MAMQPRQRELEAEREEKEDDAELGEGSRRGGAGHHRQRMGTERQPHEQIGDGRRQPEAPRHGDEQHRGGKKNQNLAERLHGR